METEKTFGGVIPPIVTPLHQDGTLDIEALEKLLAYLMDAGVSGIFLGGTSGEACYLPVQTQDDLARETIRVIGGKLPVLCGVIEPSTVRSIQRIRRLEDLGADCFVATPAFYLQNSCQTEIVRHFETLSAATGAKLAVYNIPGTTHVNILPRTVKLLAGLDNVVLYKDSCADFEQIQRDIYALRYSRVSLFNGAEELCAASMAFGAQGCVPGLANFYPRLFIDCCAAARRGDLITATRLQEKIVELRQVLFIGQHWMAGMKYLAGRFGFGCGALSLPIQPLSQEEKMQVDQWIEAYDEYR